MKKIHKLTPAMYSLKLDQAIKKLELPPNHPVFDLHPTLHHKYDLRKISFEEQMED